jgi:hypothetical protein
MRRLVITVVLVLGAGRQVKAQETTGAFAPLEFLVGSCWIGTFPDGKQTDEHCYEWMLDRKFIRDTHVVRGGKPYSGQTVYFWDAATKKLSFQYYSSDGFVLPGTVEPTSEGIVFPQRLKTAAGEIEMKASWTRLGADGYRVLQRQKTDTGWKVLWTMDMKRKE